MKYALIYPNNLWVAPFLNIYTKVLDHYKIEYDIISWCRYGDPESGIQYNNHENSRNSFTILWSYCKYVRFVIKTIKTNDYSHLIVFTPQLAIFMALFLCRRYKKKYIFDYRDLSIEQKAFFKPLMRMVLNNSYANVISSPGFKDHLPEGYDFIISHNFNVDLVRKAINLEPLPFSADIIKLLTIGAIRIDSNYEVMDALGNNNSYALYFVGKGLASKILEDYAKEKGYKNIEFQGQYVKDEEADIIIQNTIINIVYPRIKTHDSALSNRFYNSLIFKRPMVVTSGGVQGKYVDKYHVGLSVENCNNLDTVIKEYVLNLDFYEYTRNCNNLLRLFLDDYNIWLETVKSFLNIQSSTN